MAGETLANLTARFSSFAGDAPNMALKQMMLLARQQGTVMAFADVFWLLALLFAAFGLLAVLMRRPPPLTAAPAGPLRSGTIRTRSPATLPPLSNRARRTQYYAPMIWARKGPWEVIDDPLQSRS